MTVEYKEHPALQMVEIVVDGKVTTAEFEDIAPKMEKFIEEHGKIKIIEIIKNYDGFEWGMIGEGIRFDMKHLKDFSHCAVVCGEGWRDRPDDTHDRAVFYG